MTENSNQSRRSFGDYDLVRELGRGGMGLVYEAHERALDRRVALKVLPKELAHDASYAQRFLNEARAAARLNHPNIVTIHAVGQVNDRHYIAMELVEGVSLSAWVKKHGPMDAQQALGLIRQVAEALAEAHRRGIIHRDIKPQNIMVDETGRVKVLDFGLAKVLESASELTAQGSQLGTPRYMAPEQIQGKQVDARSDIYSLGVVLYELLAGRVAIEGDSPMTVMYKIVHEPFPAITQSNPKVPLPVVQLLQKMTAREPDRRPQTAPELIQAIDSARAGRMVFENLLGQPGALQPTGLHDVPLLDDRMRTEITGIFLASAGQPKKLRREFPVKQVGIVAAILVGIVIIGFPVFRSVSSTRSVEYAQGDEQTGRLRDTGWIDLLAEASLSEWHNPNRDVPPDDPGWQWHLVDGVLTNRTTKQGQTVLARYDIATVKWYKDFDLHLDFRISPGGNSGVYLRGCVEIQVIDNAPDPKKATGSVFGIYAPRVEAMAPVGDWNTLDVSYIGDELTVRLNGYLIHDRARVSRPTYDVKTGDIWTGGPVLLQDLYGQVWYRNIRIRPL